MAEETEEAPSALHKCSNQDDFSKRLEDASSNLVCIYFTAPWCDPCKEVTKLLIVLAAQEPDVVFLLIDASELEDVVTMYEVKLLPSFLIIKNKEKLESFIGSKIEGVKEYIEKLKMPEQPDA